MGKESKAKALRKAIYGKDNSRRERRYGVLIGKDGISTGEIVEVGKRGFERRWRRGTLRPGTGLMNGPVEVEVAE